MTSHASHAIEAGILFASLILIGPGRYALAAGCCGKDPSKKEK